MEKDFDKCLRDTFHIIASEISVSDSEKIKKCIERIEYLRNVYNCSKKELTLHSKLFV